MPPRSVSDDYTAAKDAAVAAMVVMLQAGDRAGMSQQAMAAEFMVAFQSAAQEAAA